jgi:uncharacterized protein YjiK
MKNKKLIYRIGLLRKLREILCTTIPTLLSIHTKNGKESDLAMRCKNYLFNFLLLLTLFIVSCNDSETDSTEKYFLNPIAEIDLSSFLSEPSGIVYNSISNSFYVVSDTISKIFEIDLEGNLLNAININADDLEGISLSKNSDTIYVVEESDHLITSFLTNGSRIGSISISVSTNSSNSLEGITIDDRYNIFVINEKVPRYLIKLENNLEVSRVEITAVKDLSDICYDPILDCMWIISDESEKIIKITNSGSVIAQWQIPFSKGEGITLVNDKIYVVRDTDAKMFIFNKPGS